MIFNSDISSALPIWTQVCRAL